MKSLEKIFEDIAIQLKEEKSKYRKLKIRKYSFEISKFVSYHYQLDYPLLMFLLSFLKYLFQ